MEPTWEGAKQQSPHEAERQKHHARTRALLEKLAHGAWVALDAPDTEIEEKYGRKAPAPATPELGPTRYHRARYNTIMAVLHEIDEQLAEKRSPEEMAILKRERAAWEGEREKALERAWTEAEDAEWARQQIAELRRRQSPLQGSE